MPPHEIRKAGTSHNHDLFRVAGTRFAFPMLPPQDEVDPCVYAAIAERRDEILAEAAEVQFTSSLRKTKPRPPRRSKKLFVPKPGTPGSLLTCEGQDREVWSFAPRNRRWVTHDQTYVQVDLEGREHARLEPDQQRSLVVRQVQIRSAPAIAATVVPRPSASSLGGEHSAAFLAAEQRRAAAEQWAGARIAHQLYPDHYPDPGPFIALITTGHNATDAA